MANPPTDINSILQMLQDSQQRAPNPAAAPSSLPPRGPPGAPYGAAPQNLYAAQAAPYQPAPASYGYPQPAASGSIDLSAIKPAASGAVPSFEVNEAIAKARAMAQEAGLNPYDRQSAGYPGQDSRGPDSRSYQPQRSRSKSPRGRDAYRDNFNPYRDERRGDHGGQGRDYGRDRSFSPRRQGFSPRGAHGNGRDRSPLRNKEENVETMEIEASLVGLIIGRQGENLRRVESESRCRVQFIPPNGNETFRLCRISGPRAQREEAKEMINRIIRDSGMRGGPPGGGGPGGPGERAGRDSGRPDRNAPPVPKEGEDSLQIMVPDRTVGLIIGRGGETIRDLQERSGCHINIVHESKSINGLRPVNLIGTPGAAKLAKDLILEIVDSDSRNSANSNPAASNPRGNRNDGGYNNNPHGGPDKINDSIYVPSDAVGMIIGKGGETIREMQNSTGCKINVSQSSGSNETQREIGLVGSRDSIERAKIAIQDKVDAARMKSGGGGGGGRGRGQHRDYDNPNYGQQSSNQHSSYAQQSAPASNAPPAAGANAVADPYAVYGGYENYLALWYSSQAAQQAPGQPGAGNA